MSYRRSCVIPIAPIRRVLKAWAEENGWDGVVGNNFHSRVAQGYGDDRTMEGITQSVSCWERLSTDTGIRKDTLRNYATRSTKKWIEFDMADKIITTIDPALWITDPELNAIYENFDLSGVDELSSCVAA